MRVQAARLGCALLVLAGLAGCRSASNRREQLASSNPLDQVTAAVRLAEAGDAQAVHRLVSLLEDRDRAVRMYAILALERLCGQDYGYHYYGPAAERTAAVRRWRAALRRGEVSVATPNAPRADAALTDSDAMADRNPAKPGAPPRE